MSDDRTINGAKKRPWDLNPNPPRNPSTSPEPSVQDAMEVDRAEALKACAQTADNMMHQARLLRELFQALSTGTWTDYEVLIGRVEEGNTLAQSLLRSLTALATAGPPRPAETVAQMLTIYRQAIDGQLAVDLMLGHVVSMLERRQGVMIVLGSAVDVADRTQRWIEMLKNTARDLANPKNDN